MRVMKISLAAGLPVLAAIAVLPPTIASRGMASEPLIPRVAESNGIVRVRYPAFTWEWSPRTDVFQIMDAKGRRMVKGKLQPEVIVQNAAGARQSQLGQLTDYQSQSNSLSARYTNRNDAASLSITVRFDPSAVWVEPVGYAKASSNDIVELRYFSENENPNLACYYAVIPGIEESAGTSPIVTGGARTTLTSWLGRGGPPAAGLHQQWGLPVHYFCGFECDARHRHAGALTDGLSDAFCLGLASLPAGDLFVLTSNSAHSLIVSTRSDIWHHLRGPGPLELGAKMVFAFGSDFRGAIRSYYTRLVEAGIVEVPPKSSRKEAAMAAPQFNTWAEQVATDTAGRNLTERALTGTYDRMRALGMRPGMFVIDDQWEGTYGNLQHSAERLPGFEQFLARVRADGLRVGLWAAFMRCENPAELGLTPANMLRGVDGKPIRRGRYYLLDYTQPEVQAGLRERAQRFIRRYHPDLVKFDFGYEIPSLALAAPRDMNYAGERMLLKGLEVVVEAMRLENPDIVLMYYSLSPLLNKYIDLHSPDDLFLNAGEYDVEANRRFYFSSVLSEIGMPTYGSGGYDWETMPAIWFDSALLGTLGSLQPLGTDERGNTGTPERIAKYNGLIHLLRPASKFHIEVLGGGPVFAPTRGAHASSWARYEGDDLVGVALRERAWPSAGIEASAPLVIAARGQGGLHGAPQLALVPYGEGELKLKHDGANGRFAARRHVFGGGSEEGYATLTDGVLKVGFTERTSSDKPIEWIEIDLTAR
jgi:hypothetical protein